MIVYNRYIAQVALFSTLLLLVPMFYFPARFGLDLAIGTFTYSMFEMLFYGIIFFIFRPESSLLQLVAGSGITFLYRILLGTVYGVLLVIVYGMDFSVSLTLGISRYLPAIIPHILAAPFVMRPFFLAIADQSARSQRSHRQDRQMPTHEKEKEAATTPYFPKSEQRSVSSGSGATEFKSGYSLGNESIGFDRSVRYLGEHHAVQLAAVVDGEGLLLASFGRGDEDPALWAPYSLLFEETNQRLLQKNAGNSEIGRVDLVFGSRRLVVVRIDSLNLLVLLNHEEDDLINIRITQSADIVRKHLSERYGNLLPSGREEKYVSNT